MIQLVRGPLREGSRWAWLFMVQSLVLWFVLDTGMSIVLGYPTHALFNIPFRRVPQLKELFGMRSDKDVD
jgi:hypothetical protein